MSTDILRRGLLIGVSLLTAAVWAAEMPAPVIELDETVISGNQELPKVLYIVPWQQPDGLPEIELDTEFSEQGLFRRLYPPAHRRELGYSQAAAEDRQTSVSKER
jgi:hypothetical protein